MARVATAGSELSRPVPEAGPGTSQRERSAARLVAPLLQELFSGIPVRFCFWDASIAGPDSAPGTVVFHSPDALKRLLWAPNELGLARTFVAGDVDIDGDFYEVLRLLRDRAATKRRPGLRAVASAVFAAARLGALGPPPRPPDEEVRLSGWRHSKRRDAAAIRHHYDVSDAFYRLVLGPSMTYSCARFEDAATSLEDAQRSKHDLVCRKLGLHERPGMRLLDVGCGWGSMALHAAGTYGTRTVAVTISPSQAKRAQERVSEAQLGQEVEVRLQDYRDLRGETFDAISSIGMFEHVGAKRMDEYFATLFSLLAPGGRLLNHAISKVGGSKMQGRTFINRYVFPDGELIDVAVAARAMERAGFEVRDVESLREHYALTLRAWVANLDASWDEAVHIVGQGRARVWKLYMSASANGFEDGSLSVHQVLGVRPGPSGASGMPRARSSWG